MEDHFSFPLGGKRAERHLTELGREDEPHYGYLNELMGESFPHYGNEHLQAVEHDEKHAHYYDHKFKQHDEDAHRDDDHYDYLADHLPAGSDFAVYEDHDGHTWYEKEHESLVDH